MTYPAPEVLQDDPWFGPAPETEKSIALKELKAQLEEHLIIEEFEVEKPKEAENIHEVMYKIATQNVATTLALDPLPTLGGGSEQFQEGWMSGAGPHFK
jgi:hypothetical protein